MIIKNVFLGTRQVRKIFQNGVLIWQYDNSISLGNAIGETFTLENVFLDMDPTVQFVFQDSIPTATAARLNMMSYRGMHISDLSNTTAYTDWRTTPAAALGNQSISSVDIDARLNMMIMNSMRATDISSAELSARLNMLTMHAMRGSDAGYTDSSARLNMMIMSAMDGLGSSVTSSSAEWRPVSPASLTIQFESTATENARLNTIVMNAMQAAHMGQSISDVDWIASMAGHLRAEFMSQHNRVADLHDPLAEKLYITCISKYVRAVEMKTPFAGRLYADPIAISTTDVLLRDPLAGKLAVEYLISTDEDVVLRKPVAAKMALDYGVFTSHAAELRDPLSKLLSISHISRYTKGATARSVPALHISVEHMSRHIPDADLLRALAYPGYATPVAQSKLYMKMAAKEAAKIFVSGLSETDKHAIVSRTLAGDLQYVKKMLTDWMATIEAVPTGSFFKALLSATSAYSVDHGYMETIIPFVLSSYRGSAHSSSAGWVELMDNFNFGMASGRAYSSNDGWIELMVGRAIGDSSEIIFSKGYGDAEFLKARSLSDYAGRLSSWSQGAVDIYVARFIGGCMEQAFSDHYGILEAINPIWLTEYAESIKSSYNGTATTARGFRVPDFSELLYSGSESGVDLTTPLRVAGKGAGYSTNEAGMSGIGVTHASGQGMGGSECEVTASRANAARMVNLGDAQSHNIANLDFAWLRAVWVDNGLWFRQHHTVVTENNEMVVT